MTRQPLPMPALPPRPLAMPLLPPAPYRPAWGSVEERVRWRRIMVCVWSYAYEVEGVSLVSDGAFDEVCRQVAAELHINTNRPDLDAWFRREFNPSTGMWIHHHPELGRIKHRYENLFATR